MTSYVLIKSDEFNARLKETEEIVKDYLEKEFEKFLLFLVDRNNLYYIDHYFIFFKSKTRTQVFNIEKALEFVKHPKSEYHKMYLTHEMLLRSLKHLFNSHIYPDGNDTLYIEINIMKNLELLKNHPEKFDSYFWLEHGH